MPHLLISVRFHDGRYHGRGDWPPGPARLFQALVAGAADGETLAPGDERALAWLERLTPPAIAAPPERAGQGFRTFVPNNDLDAVGGDPRRVGAIRAAKLIRPVLFDAPQGGPLLIGDGRYLGLGLMRPVQQADGVLALAIVDGMAADAEPIALTRALRRAVLARAQAVLGEGKPLPSYITGHEADGTPLRRDGAHRHIAFAYETAQRRLLILAPHVLERRSPWRGEPSGWRRLEEAMRRCAELRAGAAGMLRVVRTGADPEASALLAPARHWESATLYRAVRHRKLADAAAALAADIAEECRRLRLPRVDVTVLGARGIAGQGLAGRARLRFATAVPGPILIGRDRHLGGGLFVGRPHRGD